MASPHGEYIESAYEDDEDRLSREGQARYAAMTPEARAIVDQYWDEAFAQMQDPTNIALIDRVFRATPDELRAIYYKASQDNRPGPS